MMKFLDVAVGRRTSPVDPNEKLIKCVGCETEKVWAGVIQVTTENGDRRRYPLCADCVKNPDVDHPALKHLGYIKPGDEWFAHEPQWIH